MSLPGLVCAGEPATCDDILNHDRRELSGLRSLRSALATQSGQQAGPNCMSLEIQQEKDNPDPFDL